MTASASHTWYGKGSWDDIGLAVSKLGDVKGDGADDVLVGGDLSEFGGTDTVRVYVYSGKSLELTTDTHTTSLKSGGQQTFSIDAGPGNKHADYWLLGSFTGTQPGS